MWQSNEWANNKEKSNRENMIHNLEIPSAWDLSVGTTLTFYDLESLHRIEI